MVRERSSEVFYGRPAILQIQGPAEDVERFAGVAKRREIVREHEIELRHRSFACNLHA